HVIQYGGEVKDDEVIDISQNPDKTFTLTLGLGEKLQTHTVLLAIGTKRRMLNAPGERELDGKGITYCATCDGFFFRGKTVAVVGGGDAAATAALYLAEFCPKVYLLVRKEKMRAEPIWIEQIALRQNIEVLYSTAVKAFHGTAKLETVDLSTGRTLDDVKGVFIEIGAEPNTALVDKFELEKDAKGFLVVNQDQSTKIPGLFAAGDITNLSNHFHQIATAIGEGSVAANSLFMYRSAHNDQS